MRTKQLFAAAAAFLVFIPAGARADNPTIELKAPYADVFISKTTHSDGTALSSATASAFASRQTGEISLDAAATDANPAGVGSTAGGAGATASVRFDLQPIRVHTGSIRITAHLRGRAVAARRTVLALNSSARVSAVIEGAATDLTIADDRRMALAQESDDKKGPFAISAMKRVTENGYCPGDESGVPVALSVSLLADVIANNVSQGESSADLTLESVTIELLPCAPEPQHVGVDVLDDEFAPPGISVPAGSEVIWEWKGQGIHSVTADDASFDSDFHSTGFVYSHTFGTSGVFAYYCRQHGGPGGQGMSGTITVT